MYEKKSVTYPESVLGEDFFEVLARLFVLALQVQMVLPILKVPGLHRGIEHDGHLLAEGVQDSIKLFTHRQISVHAPELARLSLNVGEALLNLGQLGSHFLDQVLLLDQRVELGLGLLSIQLAQRFRVRECVSQSLVSIL